MLIDIREEMAREADFDTDLYLEMVRTGRKTGDSRKYAMTEPAEGPAMKRSKRKRPVD